MRWIRHIIGCLEVRWSRSVLSWSAVQIELLSPGCPVLPFGHDAAMNDLVAFAVECWAKGCRRRGLPNTNRIKHEIKTETPSR